MEKRNTRFQKGEGGNPKGRKPGTVLNSTKLRQQLVDQIPAAIKTIIEAMKSGDVQAAKIVIDKCLPNVKPQALPIAVPIGDNLSETGGNLINALLAGQIPPDIGAQVIAALAAQSKIIEIDELTKRVEALEQHQDKTA